MLDEVAPLPDVSRCGDGRPPDDARSPEATADNGVAEFEPTMASRQGFEPLSTASVSPASPRTRTRGLATTHHVHHNEAGTQPVISLQKASYSFVGVSSADRDGHGQLVLREIDLQVPPGSLTVVIGEVPQ